MKYVMFLRGINVGGIKVPMAELRACLDDLGLDRIKTYLQTGNVVFESDKSIDDLKRAIEAALGRTFNYQAFVLIYSFDQLAHIIEQFPFNRNVDEHAYVIFCENEATVEDLVTHEPEIDHHIEAIAKGPGAVYWRVPKGSTLDTPFAKIMAKPKYKAVTTNRNINTLEKMQ